MKSPEIVYSLVVPIYNEEAVLPFLLARLDHLLGALDGAGEVILVDDGSRDLSSFICAMRVKDDPRFRYVGLSRNFGHQIAITAGMERARGAAIIVMDADLQDPPEVVLEMAAKWREGNEIVYAKRLTREGESAFKLASAALFYRLLNKLSDVEIPRDVGDFRLVDRKALDAFLQMPERDRFVRGMFSWLGFKQAYVEFHREQRFAGATKYSLKKMVKLAVDGVIGFSDAPLRAVLWLGAAVSGGAILFGIWIIALALFGAEALAPGWASLAVLTSLLAGMNLFTLGVVGIYVGRIHREVKQRPLYVVGRELGFAHTARENAFAPRDMAVHG